jgi:hypothetical protein
MAAHAALLQHNITRRKVLDFVTGYKLQHRRHDWNIVSWRTAGVNTKKARSFGEQKKMTDSSLATIEKSLEQQLGKRAGAEKHCARGGSEAKRL